MSMLKQVVLIREDLQLPRGLLAAQVAHIHALRLRESILANGDDVDSELIDWLETPYLFVHGVPNIEVLSLLIKKAEQHGVPTDTWQDTIYLKVGDENVAFQDVLVGASLGPCDSDLIKAVIGTLGLLA